MWDIGVLLAALGLEIPLIRFKKRPRGPEIVSRARSPDNPPQSSGRGQGGHAASNTFPGGSRIHHRWSVPALGHAIRFSSPHQTARRAAILD